MPNNYIVLTGASGNIGNKLAYFLLNKGYALIITSRNIKHLEEMHNMFQEYKNSIVFKELDLADQKSIERFVESLCGLRIKGLVNNAATDNVDTLFTLLIFPLATLLWRKPEPDPHPICAKPNDRNATESLSGLPSAQSEESSPVYREPAPWS